MNSWKQQILIIVILLINVACLRIMCFKYLIKLELVTRFQLISHYLMCQCIVFQSWRTNYLARISNNFLVLSWRIVYWLHDLLCNYFWLVDNIIIFGYLLSIIVVGIIITAVIIVVFWLHLVSFLRWLVLRIIHFIIIELLFLSLHVISHMIYLFNILRLNCLWINNCLILLVRLTRVRHIDSKFLK